MAKAKAVKTEPVAGEKITSQENVAALEATIKELETNLEELNAVNNELSDRIEELEVALKNAEKGLSAPKEKKKAVLPKAFKHKGKNLVFLVPQFTNPLDNHAVITAEEAQTNDDLMDYLVANDCGVVAEK